MAVRPGLSSEFESNAYTLLIHHHIHQSQSPGGSKFSECNIPSVDLGHIYESGARSITIQKKIFPAPCTKYQQQPSTKMEETTYTGFPFLTAHKTHWLPIPVVVKVKRQSANRQLQSQSRNELKVAIAEIKSNDSLTQMLVGFLNGNRLCTYIWPECDPFAVFRGREERTTNGCCCICGQIVQLQISSIIW